MKRDLAEKGPRQGSKHHLFIKSVILRVIPFYHNHETKCSQPSFWVKIESYGTHLLVCKNSSQEVIISVMMIDFEIAPSGLKNLDNFATFSLSQSAL